ncbi:unnamed protein product [Adineta steineri]|uniref:Uncharacterized protein n=1 Tax=Adineta steineri TaxID=433720 RepID=A0A819SPD6_9BILA|nr:unnamed protein product [Adineta steineri]CAF4062939.1 unnamed protein product [Adineta steineri]
MDISRRWNFQKQIDDLFYQAFSVSIPIALERRAGDEKQLIQSIQAQLKEDELILRRTVNEQNIYFLSHSDESDCLDDAYMDDANCFELMSTIDDVNNTEPQQLNELINSVTYALEKLKEKRLITVDHLNKMQFNRREIIVSPS